MAMPCPYEALLIAAMRRQEPWLSDAELDALHRFLVQWIQINTVVELRQLGVNVSGGAQSAYLIEDPQFTAGLLGQLLSAVSGVNLYMTTQRVHPGCICRAPLMWVMGGKGVGAADITALTHLVLDFDPVRPAGIPASDQEHARAREASDWLIGAVQHKYGYTPRLVLDTGNGVQVLYALELEIGIGPNTQARLKRVLEYLGTVLQRRYPDVQIDPAASNIAQLTRVPYSTNAKGYPWRDRVHRRVSVLEFEPSAAPIDLSVWDRTDPVPVPPETHGVAYGHNDAVPLDALVQRLRDAGLEPQSPRPTRNGGYIIPLARCAFDPDHTGGRQNPAAFWNDGRIGYKCFHTECVHKSGVALRRLLGF